MPTDPPKKRRGRPRKFETVAAKQRDYRARKVAEVEIIKAQAGRMPATMNADRIAHIATSNPAPLSDERIEQLEHNTCLIADAVKVLEAMCRDFVYDPLLASDTAALLAASAILTSHKQLLREHIAQARPDILTFYGSDHV